MQKENNEVRWADQIFLIDGEKMRFLDAQRYLDCKRHELLDWMLNDSNVNINWRNGNVKTVIRVY